MPKEILLRAINAAQTEHLDMEQKTILEGNSVKNLTEKQTFVSPYTNGFINGYITGASAEKNVLLSQTSHLIESMRQRILENPNDPSWTEHLTELQTQIQQLASQHDDNKFGDAVQKTQQECSPVAKLVKGVNT